MKMLLAITGILGLLVAVGIAWGVSVECTSTPDCVSYWWIIYPVSGVFAVNAATALWALRSYFGEGSDDGRS